MKRYAEMKESGVRWIGEIPTEWEVHRIKNNFVCISGSGFNASLQGNKKGDFPICKASDIKNAGHYLKTSSNYLSSQQVIDNGFTIIPQNSILFPKIGEAMRKNRRTLTTVPCCIDNNCQAIVPCNINQNFSYYLMLCVDLSWFDSNGTVPFLNNTEFRAMKFPFPPRAEQDQIVRFLDWKVSAINRLIALRKKQIARLEELKKTVISRAVTKGLDPNAPMKDSGVRWIGKIPAEWDKKRIKTYVNMKSGNNVTSVNLTEAGPYPVYGGNGFRGFYSLYNCDGNYILIGRQGALAGNVHIVHGKFWATDHALILTIIKEVNINFLYYLLIAMNLNQYAFDTSAQPGITATKILDMTIPIPPRAEQNQIAAYLDAQTAKIDVVIHNKKQQIDTLQEFKTRLISDVVTGKIDVRGLKIPDYEYAEEEADEENDAEGLGEEAEIDA